MPRITRPTKQSKQISSTPGLTPGLVIGHPFNPFRVFTGIFIPEEMIRYRGLSPGAKIAYGRLCRYAGENGHCYPAIKTLAAEIGVGESQCKRYLAELEMQWFIQVITRYKTTGEHDTNGYKFLWHQIFNDAMTRVGPDMNPPVEGVGPQMNPGVGPLTNPPIRGVGPYMDGRGVGPDMAPGVGSFMDPKESQLEENIKKDDDERRPVRKSVNTERTCRDCDGTGMVKGTPGHRCWCAAGRGRK